MHIANYSMNEKEMRLKKEERVSSMKAFFALETAGFSSRALKILTSLASSEHAEALEAQTLLPDFTFFCSLLYGNLIPSSLSFQSWTSKTKEEQIQLITEHWSHFFPISEGIPSLCDLFSTYISPNFPSLEEEFLLTIVRHLKKASSSSSSSYALKLLEECVVLAERSVPTMAKEKRCVKDISSMVHFVVEVCFAFDETETSLPLLWRLGLYLSHFVP